LSNVFLPRRRDFVGAPVPVRGKADDHALLVLNLRCALWAVTTPI
jgi:hypothetical protein